MKPVSAIGIAACTLTALGALWAARCEYDKRDPPPPAPRATVEVTWELQSGSGAQLAARNLGPNTIRDLQLLLPITGETSGFIDTEHPSFIRALPINSSATVLTLWKGDRMEMYFSQPPGEVPAPLVANDGDGHPVEVTQRILPTR